MKKAKTIKTKSGFEKLIVENLQKRGKLFTYEAMKLKYNLHNLSYTPDLVLKSGIVVELKGYFRRESQVKMRAVKESHPELDIRLVFQKASSTIQGSKKMTCAAWAEKYGFIYAEGQVPDAWFEWDDAPELESVPWYEPEKEPFKIQGAE